MSNNGDKYEGLFISNEFEGLGVITKPDGTQYIGNFKNSFLYGIVK